MTLHGAKHPLAAIDRRVCLLSDDYRLCRVSDLRELPYVVLLGEPGMGKSSVFEAEAATANAKLIDARLLARGLGKRRLASSSTQWTS